MHAGKFIQLNKYNPSKKNKVQIVKKKTDD